MVASSSINFIDSCDIIQHSTSTEVICYSPATSFIMIVLVFALFFGAMIAGYKLFKSKDLPIQ